VLDQLGRRNVATSHGRSLIERGKIVQRGHARSVRVPASDPTRTIEGQDTRVTRTRAHALADWSTAHPKPSPSR
jgi:hypothetical protein